MTILFKKYKKEIILSYIFSLLFLWDINFNNLNLKFFLYPLLIVFFVFNFKNYSLILLSKIALINLLILLHQFYFAEVKTLNLKNVFEIFSIFLLYFFCLSYYKIFINNVDSIIKFFIIFFIMSLFISGIVNFSTITNYDFTSLCSYKFSLLNEKYLFKEKSHLGMVSVGIASYLLYTFNKIKKIYLKIITSIFLILLFINSSTLFLLSFVVSNCIIFIFNFKNLNKNSIPALIISFIFIFLLSNSTECSKRFKHVSDTLEVYKIANEINNEFLTLNNKNFNKGIKQTKKNTTENELNIKTDNEINDETLALNYKNFNEEIKRLKKIRENELKKEIESNLTNNFTTQVHIRALMIAKKSIINSPFGFGFSQYNIAHKKYSDELVTINPAANNLNLNDGTNNFVKLVTEFGFLSFFFFIICFLFLKNKNINFELKLFILPFLISQGMRGAGYWNGGFLFIFMIVVILLIKNINKHENNRN